MKTIIAYVVTTVLIVAMTLAAMFLLVWATVEVTSLPTPLHRALGMGAELVLGIVLLLGTTWLATHLAVRIFGRKETPPLPPPAGLSKAPEADRSGGSVV
jgi:uncharacterized PurR-regulated membrane protein YhhQ (DUF165 family)